MKKSLALFVMTAVCLVTYGAEKNLALGKKVSLYPSPNYALCKDADDSKQLTDGKYSKGSFWTQKGTVGWTRRGTVSVTVDLGKIYPISGFSWDCAAGRAGVEWPNVILIMVSDDGEKYYPVGDLIAFSAERKVGPKGFQIFNYVTKNIKTYGRYVKFMTISSGPYIFVDEVEVFAGKENYKKLSLGKAMNPKKYAESKIFSSYIKKRFNKDLDAVRTNLKDSNISKNTKAQLSLKINNLVAKLDSASKISADKFKAVFPYNSWHKQLIAIRADIWQAQGMKKILVNNANRWDMEKFWNQPDLKSDFKSVSIAMMRNEIRSAVINISNPMPRTAQISISTTGNIPENLLRFKQVEWVDTKKGTPVAAALTALDGNKKLTIIPGMTRQLWIQADSKNIATGNYKGNLVLNKITVPISIKIAPLNFPKRPRLHVGGWDYTDKVPSRGITKGNVKQVIKHLQERYVDVPWATSSTMPTGRYDKTGKMIKEPDTKKFDNWLKLWPDARIYAVFLSVGNNIRGLKMNSPAFKVAVTNWIKWWKNHCLKKGIKPSQIALLLVDEPHSVKQDEIILTWAKVIKTACPEFIIWEDPTWKTPAKHSVAMLDISDVLCPNRPMYLNTKAYRDFYNERAKKQTMWLYSCSGPARLLDPYSYFLLQAWECLRIGGKSTHFWAFGDTGGGKSSWNPYLQKGTSFVPYYIDKNSVTPAKYMEAIAESVRDYEYFMMLKDATSKAKKRGIKKSIVAKAEKLLKDGPARVLNAKQVSTIEWTSPKDRTIADKVRLEALELLTKLNQK
jgi:hypothetical protein